MSMEGGVKQPDTSETDSIQLDMSSMSDMFVPKRVHGELMKLKCEYIRHIQLLDEQTNSTDALNSSSSSINFLLDEQLVKTMNKSLKKAEISDLYLSLLTHVRPLCLSSYSVDDKPNVLPQEEQVQLVVTKVDNFVNEFSKFDFSDIQNKLSSLQTSIDSLNSQRFTEQEVSEDHSVGKFPYNNAANADNHDFNDKNVRDAILDIPHVDNNIPDFITKDEITELSTFFDASKFTKENGHGTIKFGENYNYNGSRNKSIAMPAIVNKLLTKLNEEHVGHGKPQLNSCLINKYEGPDSFIKEHSDNERSIERDSSIFTVSIGQTRTVNFCSVVSGETPSLRVDSGSMYSMSRISQELYRHRIDKEDGANGVRYSLTFRSVCWRNHNRTLLIGDSNTTAVKFGEGGGTLGASIPGKRLDGFTIDQIDPVQCIAYNNIVIHCGINNIKSRHVESDSDINDVYRLFKNKVEDIRRVNNSARIMISPILPTRLPGLNRKALLFNKFIFNDLERLIPRVMIIHGYDDMLGDDNCLSMKLARYNDYLHLNASGIRYLARCIKNTILANKQKYENKQRSSKPVTKGGAKHPT